MIKYGLLMPYLNRLDQLRMTLLSLRHHYGQRDDWQAVIVVDVKEEHPERVPLMAADIGVAHRCLIFGAPDAGPSNTPVRAYNYAAKIADAEFLLPTNPEQFHQADILGALDQHFAANRNAYVVCACEAVTGVVVPGDDVTAIRYRHKDWYQHSKHNNRMLNFCTAISTENYWKIGGFDAEFASGLGYADNDFIDKVIAAGLTIVLDDAALSLHLEHPLTHTHDRKALFDRNKAIYLRKAAERRVAGAA